ncbi:MAG TPA: hypothetical protein VMR52_12080 [Dehalococcoidia bacterium]|nr:hypothetical protein [Dehalococcoidia bacterium]
MAGTVSYVAVVQGGSLEAVQVDEADAQVPAADDGAAGPRYEPGGYGYGY